MQWPTVGKERKSGKEGGQPCESETECLSSFCDTYLNECYDLMECWQEQELLVGLTGVSTRCGGGSPE